jgi:hypothetical protein
MRAKPKSKTRPVRKSAAKRRLTDADILAELPPLTDEEKARLIEEGIAQLRAGLYVEHEDAMAWIRSLGTKNELPMPKPKRRQRKAA